MAGRRKITEARKKTFLDELAKAHSLEQASRAAGVTRRAFYEIRFNDDGTMTDFGREAQEAIERGTDLLEDSLIDLAVNGDEIHIYDRNGALLRTEKRRHVTALIFALKARRPEKFRDNHRVEHTGADGAPLEIKLSFDPTANTADELRER